MFFFHYSDYRNIQIITRDLDQAALIRTKYFMLVFMLQMLGLAVLHLVS